MGVVAVGEECPLFPCVSCQCGADSLSMFCVSFVFKGRREKGRAEGEVFSFFPTGQACGCTDMHEVHFMDN